MAEKNSEKSSAEPVGIALNDGSALQPDVKDRPPLRRRRWLRRLAAVAFGIVPFLVVELLLRLLGAGRDLSLIVPIPDAPGWYTLNSRFDEPYFGQVDLSGPEERPFQMPKPRDVRRILVVGGSTVVGFPYPSDLAFPRHMEAALSAQSDGAETIEVLNAGITAMNSSTEVAVVQEGLGADPDAIIVYTGHNEFYGPGGVASSAGRLNPVWYRLAARCRRLYLVQAFRRWTKPRMPPTDLLESLPGDVHIGLESEAFQNGIARFDDNLTEMAKLAARSNVPIVFVSPVANEHDQPPIENLRPDSNASEVGWRSKLQIGERELRSGNLATALEQLESAKVERVTDPSIHFRLAQACEKAGRTEEAIALFATAMDLDGCRFRAPAAFHSTMANVASRYSSKGALFLDLHSAICRDSTNTVPGRKHFLEHVHFTWEGNRFVGGEIAKSIWRDVWLRDWSEERSLDDRLSSDRLAVQDEDHLAASSLVVTIYKKPPFRNGVDADKLAKELIEESIAKFRSLPPDRQKLFEVRTQKEMAEDLLGELIRACRATGNEELLGHWLEARVVRQPWRCKAVDELSRWLRKRGDSSKADRVQAGKKRWPCRL